MTPDELLEITPDLLARAILHRRERLAEAIPEQLDARQEELDIAVPLTRTAKENRDNFDKEINEISDTCLHSQTQAKLLFTVMCNSLQEGASKHYQGEFSSLIQIYKESNENHQQQGIVLDQMKDLATELFNNICNEGNSSSEIESQQVELLNVISKSVTSHEELLPLQNNLKKFNDTYLENEAMRRRADSRTALLSQALDYSERGIEHWQRLIDKGLDRLLVNAKRVREGEYSTPALSKMNKVNPSQNMKQGGD
jgi:hypothetical protein